MAARSGAQEFHGIAGDGEDAGKDRAYVEERETVEELRFCALS